MSRNYEKERKWQLKKYDEIRAKIPKELGTALRAKLKKENISVAKWISENAQRYLKN